MFHHNNAPVHKALYAKQSKNVSNNGSRQHRWAKCIAAQGEYLKVTPLRELYV
jgi:hypothetical protein